VNRPQNKNAYIILCTLYPDPRGGRSAHAGWIHAVKQDGFRLIVQRDGDRGRLFTRNGYDWSSRYPLIVEAARRIRTKQSSSTEARSLICSKFLSTSRSRCIAVDRHTQRVLA
jgi:ATP dependent DNA ligase domain